MQIGSGNDGLSSAQCVGQRAGNDLSLVFVRRYVNVGSSDQFNQLLWAHETISKDDAGLNSEVAGQVLQVQPVFLTLAPQDVWMGDAGNHVDDIAVARQDARQSLNDIFYAFVRRQ
jgi:hypothetical protein